MNAPIDDDEDWSSISDFEAARQKRRKQREGKKLEGGEKDALVLIPFFIGWGLLIWWLLS